MKIFLDTANLNEIKKWHDVGILDGVTTNPSLLAKEGKNPHALIKEICALVQGDVSVEVTESSPKKVYEQAKAISALAENIVVKIPCHINYYPVIKQLVSEGVKLNITLVFTVLQSLCMAKLGVTYISPFIGRWVDIDVDGIGILADIKTMLDQYNFVNTKLLAASVRSISDFHQAVLIGADVVTLPTDILLKATSHPLTDQGMAKFIADWQKLGISQFP
ncbi:MAG TPA: transaldolase family protein [Candidatus Babeliales bacterium]|nr:transaldolase family protein [Candidatus Babeliales bacterium]